MFETYLAEGNLIGSTLIRAQDGSDLLMYSSVDGKHFLKSRDHFRTVEDSWVAEIDSRTANANLLRLKDGRLMTIVRHLSTHPRISQLSGADFTAAFSTDDGRTFGNEVPINSKPGCYYLMNQRVLRLRSGRILLPLCWVPDEELELAMETTGSVGCFYSDDEGKTWQEGEWLHGSIVDQLAEPMVVEGSGDRLHMYMRTGMGYLFHSVSDDQGIHWTTEEATPLRSPCAPFCARYDEKEDRFLMVWNNSFPGTVHQFPRSIICLAESTDGMSWHTLCELDADPMKGFGYPMIEPYEDEILITYYESQVRRFSPETHKLRAKILSRSEIHDMR